MQYHFFFVHHFKTRKNHRNDMANIQVLYQFNFQVVYYVQFEEAENQTTIYVVCDTKLLQIFYFASDIVEFLSKFNNKSCAIFLFIMA